MTVQLRRATPDDLDAITRVFLACWRESYRTVLPGAVIDGMSEVRARELWERALRAEGSRVLVAARDEELLGVVRFEVDRESGVVHSLYVSPGAQGLGLGSRLLGAAAEQMEREGATVAKLWVFAANAPSIAFYRANGWLPGGTERTQPEFGERELGLEKRLGPRGGS